MNKFFIHLVWVGMGLPAWAQGEYANENFKIEQHLIVWEKVFQHHAPNIPALLDKHPLLALKKDSTSGVFKCGGRYAHKKICGRVPSALAGVVCMWEISGTFHLKTKDGRYQVRVEKIRSHRPYPLTSSFADLPIEGTFLKRYGRFKECKVKQKELMCLNKILTDLFTIKENQSAKDDW